MIATRDAGRCSIDLTGHCGSSASASWMYPTLGPAEKISVVVSHRKSSTAFPRCAQREDIDTTLTKHNPGIGRQTAAIDIAGLHASDLGPRPIAPILPMGPEPKLETGYASCRLVDWDMAWQSPDP